MAIAISLGSPAADLIIVFLMPIMSVVLRAATFAISAFVWLSRILWGQAVRGRRSRSEAGGGGVDDEWLDGPA